MRFAALFRLCVTSAVVLALPGCAEAQYMYLDSNGDGVHSVADQVAGTGITTVAIWLQTNQSAEGDTATCSSSDEELTINSYEFTLSVLGGTVAWGSFVNA